MYSSTLIIEILLCFFDFCLHRLDLDIERSQTFIIEIFGLPFESCRTKLYRLGRIEKIR